MINQDRVRQMTRLEIQGRSVQGGKALRVCESRMIDYIIIQVVKGFFAGTVSFAAFVLLWFAYVWDTLNLVFADAQFMEFLHKTIVRYGIFLIFYLAACAIAAGLYYKKCKIQKNIYLKDLNRLGKSYAREHRKQEEE